MIHHKLLTTKGGYALLVWVMLSLILSFIALFIIHDIFNRYTTFTQTQRLASQDFYYAEFGIYRAKWLIDRGDVDDSVSFPFEIINSAGNLVATALIEITKDESYIISSTVDSKNITVEYQNGAILSWD